jgi:glucokinase
MISELVLAGDVGGTKTLLALVGSDGDVALERRFESGAYATFEPLVDAFLEEAASRGFARPVGAAFGVAGPVVEGRCETTNLPWILDAAALAARLGLRRVDLMNDFVAMAYGVVALPSEALVPLQARERRPGALCAVIGAGTGLGMALVSWSPDDATFPVAHATEGGHADFAPRTDEQVALLRFLREKHGRVSIERVVSGLGLADLYAFQCGRGVATSPEATAAINVGTAGAEIALRASRDADPACLETLRLFLECYGAEVGNVALRALPLGGLFIAGGIAPRMIDGLRARPFLEAMRDKGRMRALVEEIPVFVVTEPRAGLLGAASVARRSIQNHWPK